MANTYKEYACGGQNANLYTNMEIELSIDTYATGGILIEFNQFVPQFVRGVNVVDGTCSYIPTFDLANKKVMLWSALGTEASTLAGPVKVHLSLLGVNQE